VVSGGPSGLRRSGMDGAKRGRKSAECSIGPVRKRLAWLAAALGLAGALGLRARAGRRPRPALPPPAEPPVDPRAEELRRKLAESRALVEERAEFEEHETPVDEAEPAAGDPDARRRRVHDEGRAAVDEMRSRSRDD
jgi:hypothetical protein